MKYEIILFIYLLGGMFAFVAKCLEGEISFLEIIFVPLFSWISLIIIVLKWVKN